MCSDAGQLEMSGYQAGHGIYYVQVMVDMPLGSINFRALCIM